MNASKELARQFREVAFGGNWTLTNLKDSLESLDWKTASTQLDDLNTIAQLVRHLSYFFKPVTKVLLGGPLIAKDKESWIALEIANEEEWNSFKEEILIDAENFAKALDAFPNEKLSEEFFDGKYGNYFRNLSGIIEHTHYHLGQISLIKKLLAKDQAYRS